VICQSYKQLRFFQSIEKAKQLNYNYQHTKNTDQIKEAKQITEDQVLLHYYRCWYRGGAKTELATSYCNLQ
jgi:hypothetical protein